MQLDARGVMRAGGILALAAAAGVLFRRADLPLAWVLGPLLVVALFSMAGVTIKVPPLGRRVGQLVVGAAIGLQVTPAVAGRMLAWLPAMVLVALASVAVSALLSRGFSKFMRLDPATAYFSLLPGGMAEMANIGQAHGARSDVVAISQTIRLGMVVFLLPPICGLLVDSRAAPIGLDRCRRSPYWRWRRSASG